MNAVDGLIVERREPGIHVLTLHRPEVRNALNPPLRFRLAAVLNEAAADPDLRAVVITGGNDFFCSGADLRALNAASGTKNTGSVEMWAALAAVPAPVIAAVEGHAVGVGFELPLACDMIVAGRSAKFRLPEVKRGFIAGGGGLQRLARAAGKARAMKLILSAAPIDAETAERWGVVSDLVEDGQATAAALALAAEIAEHPPHCVAASKAAILEGPDIPLPAALVRDREVMLTMLDSPERRQRSQDFLDGTRT